MSQAVAFATASICEPVCTGVFLCHMSPPCDLQPDTHSCEHAHAIRLPPYTLTPAAGEHGHLVKDTSDEDQFELLSHLFLSASTEGKAQLLSAFLRISLRPGLEPPVKQRIEAVFEKCAPAAAPEDSA